MTLEKGTLQKTKNEARRLFGGPLIVSAPITSASITSASITSALITSALITSALITSALVVSVIPEPYPAWLPLLYTPLPGSTAWHP
jgi:hypothetical protein